MAATVHAVTIALFAIWGCFGILEESRLAVRRSSWADWIAAAVGAVPASTRKAVGNESRCGLAPSQRVPTRVGESYAHATKVQAPRRAIEQKGGAEREWTSDPDGRRPWGPVSY